MPRNDTDTTLHPHDIPALVAQQSRGHISTLGDGQCPQCGASPCVCALIGEAYSDEEWEALC